MAMQKLSFHWDIKNFYDCDLAVDEFFDSPQFSITDSMFMSDWKLRMYPAGSYNRKNLFLLLLSLDTASKFQTRHSISFLNRTGSRIHTVSSTYLCKSSKYNDPTREILDASNIIEIKNNAQAYADGGVLTILCEIELYEKSDGIGAAVPEKHLQMRGTSWMIQNKEGPIDLNLKCSSNIRFCLPYGKVSVYLEGWYQQEASLLFNIIDEIHSDITEVPVTIVCDDKKSNWNVKRTRTRVDLYPSNLSIQISARCMVESTPDALPIDVTPCARKMQLDYRKMFSNIEAGDISIVVDEKTIRVHKDILSHRSPVFAAMFNQEWREKTTQTVTIKDFDYKTILAMIEFIYFGGGNEDNGEETADHSELLKAAHMYQLDDLKNRCEQRLCQSLKKSNYDRYMALAYAYDLTFLKTETFSFKTSN